MSIITIRTVPDIGSWANPADYCRPETAAMYVLPLKQMVSKKQKPPELAPELPECPIPSWIIGGNQGSASGAAASPLAASAVGAAVAREWVNMGPLY